MKKRKKKKASQVKSSGKTPAENHPGRKNFLYIFCGVAVLIGWLILFVAGLLVDSSYYRAAINYNFAEFSDWIVVIFTFTVSNVVIIAFLSGILGGITSKVRATKGFTLPEKEIPAILVENPIISGFRGIFIFVAILFMQYIGSFSDLSVISKDSEQAQAATEISSSALYYDLASLMSDPDTLKKAEKIWKTYTIKTDRDEMDSTNVARIFALKDSISNLTGNQKEKTILLKKQKWYNEIGSLRRSLKVPANADFSSVGVSSFSYFKFAIIVTFLAFIFGYDPSRFTAFMERLPFFRDDSKTER